MDTPYGLPSEVPFVAEVAGRRVAFLPRHGGDHRLPPHRVPYRANLWALRSLGVRQVLAPCAVGSLVAEHGPGTLVLPDQLVDRTSGRTQTFYDTGATHVSFADPYCPRLRAAALPVLRSGPLPVVDGGTTVVVEGPRFSTRAESQWFAAQGWTLVNMTGHPEAVLARELELCYTPVALVTDLDAGVEGGESVSQEEVFRVFGENIEHLRGLLLDVVAALPAERPQGGCGCGEALAGLPRAGPPAVNEGAGGPSAAGRRVRLPRLGARGRRRLSRRPAGRRRGGGPRGAAAARRDHRRRPGRRPRPPRRARAVGLRRDRAGSAAGAGPSGALASVADLPGRPLAGPVRAGEPLTDVRLLGPALLDALPGDAEERVAVPVRLADAGVTQLLAVGDRVDVLAARVPLEEGGAGGAGGHAGGRGRRRPVLAPARRRRARRRGRARRGARRGGGAAGRGGGPRAAAAVDARLSVVLRGGAA